VEANPAAFEPGDLAKTDMCFGNDDLRLHPVAEYDELYICQEGHGPKCLDIIVNQQFPDNVVKFV